MGRPQGRGNNHSKDKSSYRKRRTASRSKDLDQIQDEVKASLIIKNNNPDISISKPINMDLPGLGQYGCLYCDKYFISKIVLDEHLKTKLHKRRIKLVAEKPYSHREAEIAAGMSTSN